MTLYERAWIHYCMYGRDQRGRDQYLEAGADKVNAQAQRADDAGPVGAGKILGAYRDGVPRKARANFLEWSSTLSRPQKPYALKQAEGFRGHRQHVPGVEPLDDNFEPPFRLQKVARKEWKRLRCIAFWLRASDAAALADRCLCFERLLEAEADVLKRGQLVPGRDDTMVQNPSVRSARGYRQALMRYDSALGLTPTARAGIDAGDPGDGIDRLEALLCGDL
jgi:P27 family predicted phage terminase small subunit